MAMLVEEPVAVEEDYYRHARPEVLPLAPANPQRVLEIGCGGGRFLRHFQNAERWGVEPNASAAAEASRVARVFTGVYEDVAAQLPERYFDVVVCNDVIEHMRDHDAFLEAIKAKIAPGGVLVGSVPNMRYYKPLLNLLMRGRWEYADEGVMDRTHLRWFTERSLKQTFARHGYTLLELKGVNGEIAREWRKPVGLLALGLCAVSLGAARDTLHMQFAFRARPS